MRGRRRGDGAEGSDTLVVELLGDDVPVDDEVDLGGGSLRPLAVIGMIAALALLAVAAVAVFSRDDDTPAAAPVTTSTIAPTTTGASPTEATAGAVPADRAVTFRVAQPPLVDTGEPWQLYLRTAGGGLVYRIDVTTGWAVPVESSGQIYKVLPGVAAPVIVDGRRAAQRPEAWVAGPKGWVWVPGDTGNSVDLIEITDAGDTLVSTVTIGPQERLIGSTADGDPVITGPNARQYVARAGGERTQLAPGLVSFVERGSYVELVCDAAQQCSIRAHGASGGSADLPYRANRAYRFSPTGSHVASLDADRLEVVDLATGSTAVSIDAPMFASQHADVPADVAWTPDGRYVMAAMDDGTLLVLDVVSGEAHAHELPEALVLGVPLAVL